MKTLYIIGNGFDLYHGLDTHYRSFGLYLQKHHGAIYDQLIEYFGLPDISVDDKGTDPLWRDFEHSLSLLDVDIVYEAFSGSIAVPGASDFRDRDWNTFAIDMEQIVESLTSTLIKAFHTFISEIDYSVIPTSKHLSLDDKAAYLNFNYTNTLEQYYRIPDHQIIYIHGKADDCDDIILGHGVNPDSFKEEEPQPPDGVSDEELERWQDHMADQYDHSFELGKSALAEYFSASFKNTKEIINAYADFYNQMNGVDTIIILGHSLSDVDLPYFEKLVLSCTNKPKFVVSYYSDSERQSHMNTLKGLGIQDSHIRMVKMDQLV